MNNKYVQRVDKQSGPSLDDFIYEKSISLNNEIKNSYNNYIFYNSPISPNEFVPRTEFKYDRNIAWYTPEMARGMVNITNKRKAVDCVLEVRDARAPLSSANPSILNHYPNHINKLVILNKADLAPKHSLQRSRELLESVGNKVILINSLSLKKIIKIKRFVTSNVTVKFPALGFWLLVVGLPNVGKSSLIKALKHHSFKEQWYSRKEVLEQERMKKTKPRVENRAGTTKLLDFFNISLNPKIFCFDTPGIMLPKMDDVEINLKLASLGCLNDSVAGEDYIADYILYRLNKLHLYTYVKTLNLSSPTNNISQISQHIGEIIEKKWNSVDPVNCYKIFINQFRMGFFGKICLDDLSNVIQLNQLNDYLLSYPYNINLILLISNSTTR